MRNGGGSDIPDRRGRFIAVANMKGGVGKTTTVVSLAEALAADDGTKKILIVDLDPQASASVAVAGDETLNELIEADRTFEAFLRRHLIEKSPARIGDMIHPTVCCTFHQNRQLDVALLPCGPKLRNVERQMTYELARATFNFASADGQIAKLFKSDLLPLARLYDYILFDCAPGISPITEMAIRLSDVVIVPTIPDRLSVYGLNAFYETIWQTKTRYLPPPKARPVVLVVRMNKGIRQHQEVLEALKSRSQQADAGYTMLTSQVPTSAALVEALMKPDYPTFVQKYTAPVISEILNPLVREIKGML